MSTPISPDSPSNRRIVAALETRGPMDVDGIAEAACIARTTLVNGRYYLRTLLDAGRIHVARWIRASELGRSGNPVAIYAAGPGKSAPRPKPSSAGATARPRSTIPT